MNITVLIALVFVAIAGTTIKVTGDVALGKRLALVLAIGQVLTVAVLAFTLLVLERGWP